MDERIKDALSEHLSIKILHVKEITVGHSLEKKYCIQTNKQKLFIRVAQMNPEVVNKYNLITSISKNIKSIVAPISIMICEMKLVLVFEWINGITLEEYYKNISFEEQITTAVKVGKAIRRFHCLTRESKKNRIIIDFEYVDFFAKKYINEEYRKSFIGLISDINNLDLEYSLIHYDLRPANFMMDDEGEIYIIDFEYMRCYPSFADLSCNLLFSDKYIYFSYGVLYGYFGCNPSDCFWKQQKSLLALELLRLSENKRNNDIDILNKIKLVEKYLFTEQTIPERFSRINTSIIEIF